MDLLSSSKHLLLLSLTSVSLMSLQAQETPLIFDFKADELPQTSLLRDIQSIVPRKQSEVSIVDETLSTRKIRVAVLGASSQPKDGFSLKLPLDDSLFGALSSVTVSMIAKVDALSVAPVFLHRLRGTRSAAGYISFEGERKKDGEPLRLKLRITTENGGEAMTSSDAIDAQNTEWMQVAIVYTGEEARFYYNGKRLGEAVPTYAGKIPAIEPDRCEIATFGFEGGIGEVVIAPNQALSDQQIATLWEKGLEGVNGFSDAK